MVYKCGDCDLGFNRYYNLQRHRNRKHAEKDEHSLDESEVDESDMETVDEESLGSGMYGRGVSKQPIDESENDDSDDNETESESEDESESEVEEKESQPQMYAELREKVWEPYADKFEGLVEEYITEGRNRADANQAAYTQLIPLYRKALRKEYIDLLLKIKELKTDSTYKAVMNSAKIFHDDDDYNTTEAIRAAVTKRKHLVNELIDVEYDNEFSNEEEEKEEEEEEET